MNVNADRPQTDIIAMALCAVPHIYVADVLAEVARRYNAASFGRDLLPGVTVTPNGHTVTMTVESDPPCEWCRDDADDDVNRCACYRVVLDTDAARLEGDAPGSYYPHN